MHISGASLVAARAPSGHVATPLRSAMKSRRLMQIAPLGPGVVRHSKIARRMTEMGQQANNSV